MTDWGRRRFITPGIAINGELVTTDLVEINLMIRILLGSSYFDGWENERDVRHPRPAGQPGRQGPPVEQDDDPEAAEARLHRQVQLGRVAAHLRQADRHARRCDTGGGPFARQWVTAKAGLVDLGFLKATGESSRWCCRRRPACPRWSSSGRCRSSRTRSSATGRGPTTRPIRRWSACTASRRRWWRCGPAGRRAGPTSRSPRRRSASASTRRRAACSRHHMVIGDGKIANYQPYPPTPWNASPRDVYGTPGPVRGCGAEHADLRGERPGELQGHRHHAGGAELRPVPAVWRAHVHRQGPGEEGGCTRPPGCR